MVNKFDDEPAPVSAAVERDTDLTASAEAIRATAAARRRVAEDLEGIADYEEQIAEIACLMQRSLDRNTEAMEEQAAVMVGCADRTEKAARDVYRAIEEQAAATIKGTAEACDAAIKKMERESTRQLEQMQAARRGLLAAAAVVAAAAVLACLLLLIAAVGFMWAQFEAGAAWISSYGWIAIPLTVLGSAVAGYLIAKKLA